MKKIANDNYTIISQINILRFEIKLLEEALENIKNKKYNVAIECFKELNLKNEFSVINLIVSAISFGNYDDVEKLLPALNNSIQSLFLRVEKMKKENNIKESDLAYGSN